MEKLKHRKKKKNRERRVGGGVLYLALAACF